MRLLWGLLGGKQILFLLDFNLQGDKAGNIVTLPPRDKSLFENRANTQDVKQKEKN